jgi:hypothetical protein
VAITGDFTKLVLSGPVSSVDTWSIGIYGDCSGITPSQSDLDSFTTAGLASFQSRLWAGSTVAYKSVCNSSTSLTTARGYVYSSGASTILESVATQAASAGTGTNLQPPFVACVFTLQTLAFGRSYRGRVYLPYTGGGMNAGTGNMTGIVQAFADEMALFLQDMAIGFGSALASSPAVYSRTKSVLTHINRVRVNTVPDTQRGRQGNAVATSSFTHIV